MNRSSEYMRGRNAKLAGLGYDPARMPDWRMGWLETNPELNVGPAIPVDWKRQVQSFRNGVQSGGNKQKQNRTNSGDVTISFDLSADQAGALAHFVNRVGTQQGRGSAVDDNEASQMRDAIIALANALVEAGYPPR